MVPAAARVLVGSMIVGIGLAAPAWGQVRSGPEVGARVSSFQVHAVTGDLAGKTADYVAERKDLPTVYLFVQASAFDRPMARFIRSLDQELDRGVEGAIDARTVAVWLTDDPNQSRDYLPRAQQSLQMTRTDLTVFEGDRFGPNGWSISGDARLTAVVIRNGQVAASLGFGSLNETDVPAIVKALKPSP
jgi:hypothetical protein